MTELKFIMPERSSEQLQKEEEDCQPFRDPNNPLERAYSSRGADDNRIFNTSQISGLQYPELSRKMPALKKTNTEMSALFTNSAKDSITPSSQSSKNMVRKTFSQCLKTGKKAKKSN